MDNRIPIFVAPFILSFKCQNFPLDLDISIAESEDTKMPRNAGIFKDWNKEDESEI
jgi:hypothetical protein